MCVLCVCVHVELCRILIILLVNRLFVCVHVCGRVVSKLSGNLCQYFFLYKFNFVTFSVGRNGVHP